MPAFLYSYAMELLKFREAGVEVIFKASSSYLDSAVILYTAVSWFHFHYLSFKCFRISETGGTGKPVHSTTYLGRLTELKSLQKLSNDW